MLTLMVPNLSKSSNRSEAVILQMTVQYMNALIVENSNLQNQVSTLIASMNLTEDHNLDSVRERFSSHHCLRVDLG